MRWLNSKRIHVQYIDKQLHFKDIIAGQDHDDVIKVMTVKKRMPCKDILFIGHKHL